MPFTTLQLILLFRHRRRVLISPADTAAVATDGAGAVRAVVVSDASAFIASAAPANREYLTKKKPCMESN